ncbi:MAG: NADH-quinone oxidoreductase subunit N [Eudoraea sp.]|nr:NADH-quinone oxidoreductase subunit N [Eudoraea sp.]
MDIDYFLIMRQEIVLLAIALILLAAEIFVPRQKKESLIHLAILLFAVHTLLGFVIYNTGELFGGMYRTNELINLFKTILNVGVLLVLLQATDWLKDKVLRDNRGVEFFVLMFSSLLGMYFLISAGDFLMMYLGIELSTLPVAGLAAYEIARRTSSEAGIKLILSSALASGVTLFGISLIYATAGSIYFDDIASNLEVSNLVILSLVLLTAGLGFKISLVPFHFWTADVYEGSPISIASYLSVVSKGAAVFILLIILFTVLSPLMDMWRPMIYVLAVATMFLGNLFALRQQNMKRFLAFSSIAQAGFILLGIITGTATGMATVVYFVLIYIFSNLAAFGVVQAIAVKTGKERINDYEGLYRTNPKLSLVLMLALFSLAGIPPVAGFFGKFFLFTAAASEGFYFLVFLGVVNVTISLYYYLLVVRAMFLRKSEKPIPYFKSGSYMRIALVLCVLGILALGLYSPVYEYIYALSLAF